MKVAVSHSDQKETRLAVQEAYSKLVEHLNDSPHLIFLYCTIQYDCSQVIAELHRLAPLAAIHGGTSSKGLLTHSGPHFGGNGNLGLLGISDPEGAYGVGAMELGQNPRQAAAKAAELALSKIDREGETPTMLWMTCSPGTEEEVILGLEDYFGPNTPIAGGSSADDKIEGKWNQFSSDQAYSNAVVIAALFPSSKIGFSFHSGYEPTSYNAVITKAQGRTIFELDGKPAVQVYDNWTNQKFAKVINKNSSIASESSLYPLGRVVGQINRTPYFQLSHPESVTEEGAIKLFTAINTGDTVWLMQGTRSSVVTRAERVARSAINSVMDKSSEISGAMVIYCAGCMMTIKEDMALVVDSLRKGLGEGVPFLGAFTFGEQGCFVGGENRHGNLMISILVFFK